MPYLLDSDTFIQAKNLHYRFVICPGYWDWIVDAHTRHLVYSIAKVHGELTAGHDQLSVWAKAQPKGFFLHPNQEVLRRMVDVNTWVNRQSFTSAAKSEFANKADSWLIAHAFAHGYCVVTHERSEPLRKNKVKIPDVCIGLNVQFKNPFTMLEDEGARFVLAGTT